MGACKEKEGREKGRTRAGAVKREGRSGTEGKFRRLSEEQVASSNSSFGLWRVCFPPCFVRPGRRLPVQGLSEGSLGYRDRLPA